MLSSLLKILCVILGATLAVCHEHRQNDFVKRDDARLDGSVFRKKSGISSALRCSALCSRNSECASFNFAKETGVCELNRETGQTDPGNLENDSRFKYYEFMNQPEEPTTYEPSTRGQTTEEPTTEEPTTEEPTTEEPDTETQTTEEPATEEPTTEEPNTETQTTEEPDTEEPTTEERTTEEPTTEEPTTEEGTTEESTTEEPTTEEPTTEEPATEEPNTETQTTEEPDTEEPTTEERTTEEPTTEEPTTEEPTTKEPTTEELTTEEPSTEKPSTERETTTTECIPGPLGLESGTITDNRITSSLAVSGHEAKYARLNGGNFWQADNDNCWVEVDLVDITMVTGIITQGDGTDKYVAEYEVMFKQSSSSSYEYVEEAGAAKVFVCTDAVSHFTHTFDPSIMATVVRIVPTVKLGNFRLRMELLGC